MNSPIADDRLRRLWDLARRSIASLQRPYGLAASEAETGLYDALFGRDSLWSLLLLLDVPAELGPGWPDLQDLGKQTLMSLADRQALAKNDLVEALPGKIPHECRTHIDARLEAYGMPFVNGCSYAGFDQTFLFVTATRRYLDRFPDGAQQDLIGAVRRAIAWIEDTADEDGDGLFEYTRRHAANPVHQVWKDSFDSVSTTGFDVPKAPIAWVELQGYAYRALIDGAALLGTRAPEVAARLTSRAGALREAVEERFWMPEKQYYAVGLDGEKQPLPSVTSNPGHLLWAGVPSDDRAEAVAARLARPDCLTQYGVRTLAASDPHYAPYAYHRGSVWPFDNAVVAAGLDAYDQPLGLDVFDSICRAIEALGSCVEEYVVIDPAVVVLPQGMEAALLTLRRRPVVNVTQAFSAAALALAVARVAARRELDLL